uniref:Eclosion hormone 1 n=1 Tax=Ophionotus victoriae TaxID=667017 RepID=A0A220W0D2_9ECHI|nr:eclosion hormone 1 precursor [Ophionotus victoriae]
MKTVMVSCLVLLLIGESFGAALLDIDEVDDTNAAFALNRLVQRRSDGNDVLMERERRRKSCLVECVTCSRYTLLPTTDCYEGCNKPTKSKLALNTWTACKGMLGGQ